MIQALLPPAAEAAGAAAASWLLAYLAHSSVWLGAAWLLDETTSLIDSARGRSALWTVALLGGVLTASVQAAAGLGGGLDVEVAESEKIVAELSAAEESVGSTVAATWSAPHRSVADPGAWLHTALHDWPFVLALAALLGSAGCLLRRWLQWRRLRRRLAARTTIRSGPLRTSLDRLVDAAGGTRPVVLSRSSAVAVPIALPGREICVPDDLTARMRPEARKAVLAHELAHVERRDPSLLLTLSIVQAALFFQPLNRLARRRIGAASEAISDRRVRERGLGPALAEGLVAAAERLRGDARSATAGLASRPDVGGRVARLLERSRPPDEDALPRSLAGPGTLLAAGLVLAPSVAVGLADHSAHVDVAIDGPTPRVVTGSGSPDVPAVRIRIRDASRPLRLTLRPGRRQLRLTAPGGEAAAVPGRAPDGSPPVLRVAGAGPGDYVLHVPPSVDRLALEVNGHLLSGLPGTAHGELPELVSAPPDGS